MNTDVAVVGLACRFPGARDARQFWANLRAGKESITFLSDDELAASGVDGALRRRPDYVKAAALLDDVEGFDARFFGYAPREARLLDPQHRLFLECSWTAVEDAGYDTSAYDGPIGVYAGSAMNTYLLASGLAERLRDEYLPTLVASDKDFLASRVSYKLDLTGPSVAVQTACSTSLVAVHLACQGLLGGECDMALAGGVSVRVPQRAGYLRSPAGVLSADGHCRTFDASATGTIFGSGVGVVVLKRLDDALADGDRVRAVIRGSAVNNDGASKVDYTAPSVGSQSEVIVEALANAGVDPGTLSYVEAHGSATPLGDPIEVAALTQAFRRATARTGFCAIGSVKTNVGHLDAAAGIAGLIKTVLALENHAIPPSLHYERPNPKIDFATTPFFVSTALADWPSSSHARRAGVGSLGIGGTNAHVVLEEAPSVPASGPSRAFQLLVLSAKTPTALDEVTRRLARRLSADPGTSLPDVAWSLQAGRKPMDHRRVLVGRDAAGARAALEELSPARVSTSRVSAPSRPIVFVFPGGGSQRRGMAADLYAGEAVFRERLDVGLEALRAREGLDLRDALLRADGHTEPEELLRPSVQLPAIFLFEHALATLWESWGVRPTAMIGFSLGEITAACLAGVLAFEDALGLVALRGRVIEQASEGAMLSVRTDEETLVPLLGGEVELASVNTPAACVVTGPAGAVQALGRTLEELGVSTRPVPIATAAHSRLLDPFLGDFEARLRGLALQAPAIPFVSNLTGTWITAEQAVDPSYWVSQLRSTVRFAAGVATLLEHPDRLFLEVGPGQTLSGFVRLHPERSAGQEAVASLGRTEPAGSDVASILVALGRLWLAGVDVDWAGFAANERRLRVPLPTYPFERERFWIDPPSRPRSRRGWPSLRLRRPEARRRTADSNGAPPPEPRPGLGAPRTPLERRVAVILQEVLGVAEIGVDDDFFELGGTSMLVAEAIARINREWRVDLALVTLLESPTAAQLARCIETAPAVG